MVITVEQCSHCGTFSPVSQDAMDDYCEYCGEFLMHTNRWYVEGEVQERRQTDVERGSSGLPAQV